MTLCHKYIELEQFMREGWARVVTRTTLYPRKYVLSLAINFGNPLCNPPIHPVIVRIAISSANEPQMSTMGGCHHFDARSHLCRFVNIKGYDRIVFAGQDNGRHTNSVQQRAGGTVLIVLSRSPIAQQRSHELVIKIQQAIGQRVEPIVDQAFDFAATIGDVRSKPLHEISFIHPIPVVPQIPCRPLQVDRRRDRNDRVDILRMLISPRSGGSQRHISTDRKSDDADFRQGAVSTHQIDHVVQIGAAATVQMRTRDQGAIAKAAHVDANRSNAVSSKFAGRANDVGRTMTPHQTVQQNCDPVSGDPVFGLLVVDHEPISVTERHDMFGGFVGGEIAFFQDRQQGLQVLIRHP